MWKVIKRFAASLLCAVLFIVVYCAVYLAIVALFDPSETVKRGIAYPIVFSIYLYLWVNDINSLAPPGSPVFLLILAFVPPLLLYALVFYFLFAFVETIKLQKSKSAVPLVPPERFE